MITPDSKRQWDFLKNLAENGNMPQAMIFSGRPFLKKKETALDLVKLLNCKEELFSKRPCENCLFCKLIEKRRHPDLILITPNEKDIQIFQIRDLQKHLNITPQLSSFKSVIIDKAERLNSYSQNCLLKTLEEPKGKVLLIFITSYLEGLLETIRSRCQILRFYPTTFFLEGAINFQEIEKILNLELWQRFSFCKDFFEKEYPFENLDSFLTTFESYLRAIFLKKLGIKNESLDSFYSKFFKNYSFFEIKEMIGFLENLRALVNSTNVNQKLALENLMLNIK